jgi:hypothetical protein
MRVSQQRQRVLLHNPSPGNPQDVHSPVPMNSTGNPHAMHMLCTSLIRAIQLTSFMHSRSPNPSPNLGTTVGTTREICGRPERVEDSSTDGSKPSTG